MSDHIQIIVTGDGSHSLLNVRLNETYHSVHGALRESLHVFIKHGLEYFAERNDDDPIRIFEVGFGTGLNALLAAQFANQSQRAIEYTSIEAFPLDQAILEKLNYTSTDDDKQLFEKLHHASWNTVEEITDHLRLRKIQTTLQEIRLEASSFDIIFYDAFAPAKQPELWEFPLLKKVTDSLHADGVFVTYCAKGQLKRDLKNLGLEVQTLAGPPGKKEMVRSLKIS